MEVSGQFHASTALPAMNEPSLPIGWKKTGWNQSRYRCCGAEKTLFPPPPHLESMPGRPAHNPSYSPSGEWSPNWVHSARRPLNGLLYLPRVIMMMENLVECKLAGETEVLGENLPQRHFVHHKSHLPDPGSNTGRRGGKPAVNRLSYGAA
jgi:hypothetical protein